MKTFHISILTALIFCSSLSLSANGIRADSVELRINWKEIKSKAYKIQHPSHWIFSQGSADGIAFTLYAPGPKSFSGYEENINLMVQDLEKKNLDLDTYTRMSERQIHTLVENSKMIISERIDSIEVPFHQIIYTGDYNGQKLKWKMRFWVTKNKAYILNYTATKENFGLYIELASEIMDTFKLE